jgi:catechol 2,3-dioxygenase-like lactoylglutathione lyase family enzyme
MLRRIDRILIRVQSIPSAVAYYRDTLGMTLLRQETDLASFRLGEGPSELVLHCDPDLPAEGIYYLVDDVRELYRRRDELRLRFVAPPAAVSRGHRATVKDPFGNILLLLDRSADNAAPDTIENAKAPLGLFPGVEQRLDPKRGALAEIYEKIGRTADDLPYTPHFESLWRAYAAAHGEHQPTRGETWRHLLNLRKGGKLPRLGPARSQPPEISPEERDRHRQMLGPDIGKRDRLPYTDRFDQFVDQFNQSQPRPLSPHLVWRLVATLAK